jgi:hypothetical protein
VDVSAGLRALLLLVTANSLPWMLARLLGARFRLPLDFGLTLPDGRAVFGSHKTWRGLLASLLGCAAVAELCGLHWQLGVQFAALSLTGDALSSAVKRRLAVAPGKEVLGLDQLPEALLPLILLRAPLGVGWTDIAAVTLAFGILDLLSARLRHPAATH